MSATATTTMVLTPPPPTNNTLAPEERSRLLRSTRKLGAILGTTPLLVEHKPEPEAPSSASASTPAPAIPPRHPNRTTARREGRIFHSPSSSGSSSETLAVSPEPDYVFVRSTTRSAGYQVQAVFENASPSSSRSASPLPLPVQIQVQGPTSGSGSGSGAGSSALAAGTTLKRKHEGPLAPITIMFPLPGPSGSKTTRSGAGKGKDKDRADRIDRAEKEKDKDRAKGRVAQPLLVRPPRAAPSSSLDASSSSTGDRHIKPDVHSNNNSPPKPPLSPVSSSFNMNVVPPSPTPTLPALPSRENGLSDREKRRKMAKLTRTLGENIPPELVFRAPSPTSNPAASSSSSGPAQVSRRTSLSISRHHPRPSVTSVFDSFHKPTKFSAASASAKFSATSSLPPLAVAETPLPPPTQTQTQSQLREQPTDKTPKRKHRPRSLTLGSSSALASATALLLHREKEATRGTTSLDIQPQTQPQPQPQTRPRAGLPLNPLSRHHQDKHSNLYAQPQASPRPFVSATVVAPQPVPARLESLEQGHDLRKGQGQAQGDLLSAEFGRRKEREWSGEWNMKDMEDVARRLRGLKGR